jgi:hypothetical protein
MSGDKRKLTPEKFIKLLGHYYNPSKMNSGAENPYDSELVLQEVRRYIRDWHQEKLGLLYRAIIENFSNRYRTVPALSEIREVEKSLGATIELNRRQRATAQAETLQLQDPLDEQEQNRNKQLFSQMCELMGEANKRGISVKLYPPYLDFCKQHFGEFTKVSE